MKKILVIISLLVMNSVIFASWTGELTITDVSVGDACGTVNGQYALITASNGIVYWITSDADNFNNVVSMAQQALINSRGVFIYARSENYAVQTQRAASDCFTGGTINYRLSILKIK